MAVICVRKSDGKLIEAQSDASAGTLMENALAAGYTPEEIEEREVSTDEMDTAIAAQVAAEKVDQPPSDREIAIAAIDKLVAKKTMDADMEDVFQKIKSVL